MKVLSTEQMIRLKELGVAVKPKGMCLMYTSDSSDNYYLKYGESTCEDDIKAFTLQDVVDLLPCEIFTSRSNFYLNITKFDGNSYTISYEIQLQDGSIEEIILQADGILECSYQMLIWVIENGHLKTK